MVSIEKENEIKKEIAYFMKRSYSKGLTTSTGGNISKRDGEYMYITCSSKDKASLEDKDIAKVSIATGENLTPELKLSIESDMHRFIYQRRKDVEAIVHLHPTFACLFSASDIKIDTTLIAESWYLLDVVEKIPYERMGTKELANAVSNYFANRENHYAALLESHGAISVGKNLLSAFDRMECLEQAAKMSAFSNLVKANGLSNERLDAIARMR